MFSPRKNKNIKRVFLLLLDSFGIGASQDAVHYGDVGADTFGHVVEYRSKQKRFLNIPNLIRWGLARAALASTGRRLEGLDYGLKPQGAYGYAVEKSEGKDTLSGHWEIAGLPMFSDWGYFLNKESSFPEILLDTLIKQNELPGLLGNCHSSGTLILDRLGAEHLATGKPIVYTSIDSVFQIAAHEQLFGLDRLYALCELAYTLLKPYRIARVIARPFLGEPGCFYRTARRKDFSTLPPKDTLLDHILSSGQEVIALGKIADIFSNKGISLSIKADNNGALFDTLLKVAESFKNSGLIFANFVDFDSNYGHRRDPEGYAKALESFDKRLLELESILQPNDLAFIIADHGCDPSWKGFDHTREHIPILVFGTPIQARFLGRREGFSDIGQSIAHYLNVQALEYGFSFL